MKLVVQRNLFLDAVNAAGSVCAVRSVMPALRNFLLHCADGQVEILATDHEISLNYHLTVDSIEELASICLPPQIMAGLLEACAERTVTLTTPFPAKAVLTSGSDRFDVLGLQSAEYPVWKTHVPEKTLSIPAAELVQLINQTHYAASSEQGRYAINGVYLTVDATRLCAVSTDGQRCAIATSSASLKDGFFALSNEGGGVIVPTKLLLIVRKLCDGVPAEDLTIGMVGRTIVVRSSKWTVSGLAVEGVFPKYEQIIPKENNNRATFVIHELLHALRKAAFLVDDDRKTVRLELNPGKCVVRVDSVERGSASVPLDVEYRGLPVSIGFRTQHLIDGLNAMTCPFVTLNLKNEKTPGLLCGDNFQYVIIHQD